MPQNYRFGGGAADTTLTPIVLVLMIVAIILLVILPRRYVIVPVLFTFFMIPIGQMLLLGSFHLYVSRIVILFGCLRALTSALSAKGEVVPGGWNSIDRTFLWYVILDAVCVVVLFSQLPAFINQIGYLWDYLGGYFLLRFFVRDERDILMVLKCFALIALLQGASMFVEKETLHNIFGYLGGSVAPDTREGKIRCYGAFEHPLMAGAFASTLLPLFLLLWKNGKAKMVAALGIIGASIMTWTTSSSTPLGAYAAGIVALCFWPLRKEMRMIRRGIVIGLIALQMVMKAPVWFLLARIDLVGGSSSYHRAELVDQFIRHFSDWWLIGTNDAVNWGLDMWDAQNQYVSIGETGGLLALIFFIAMISRSFARLGEARKIVEGDKEKEWALWCLGAAVFSNVVSFFGVNYFDQSRYGWFALLAIVSTATAPLLQTQSEKAGAIAVRSARRPLGEISPVPGPSA